MRAVREKIKVNARARVSGAKARGPRTMVRMESADVHGTRTSDRVPAALGVPANSHIGFSRRRTTAWVESRGG